MTHPKQFFLSLHRLIMIGAKFSALVLVFVFLSVSSTVQETRAQTIDQELASPETTDRTIKGWSAQLDQITRSIQREGLSSQELVSFRERVIQIRDEASALDDRLKPIVQSLTARLDRLIQAEGAQPPAEAAVPLAQTPDKLAADGGKAAEARKETGGGGSPSRPPAAPASAPTGLSPSSGPSGPAADASAPRAQTSLQKDIASLESQIATLNAQSGRTQVVMLRAEELISEITQLRRSRFTNQLLERHGSLLSPALWVTAIQNTPPFLEGVKVTLYGGGQRIINQAPIIGFLAFAAGLLLVVGFLRYFSPLRIVAFTKEGGEEASARLRAINALRSVLRSVIAFCFVPTLTLFVLDQAGVMSDRVAHLFWTINQSIFYYAIARGLSSAIFSPSIPEYRLVAMHDSGAARIHRTIMTCLTISLVGFLVIDFARTLVAPPEISVVVYGLMAIGFSATALFSHFLRGEEERQDPVPGFRIFMGRFLRVFISLALIVALFGPVLGFPYLAGFAISQIILAGNIFGILLICFLLLDAFFGVAATPEADNALSAPVKDAKGRRYIQAMMLASGSGKILVTIFGLTIFAASWGLDTTGVWDDLARLFQEIKIGELTISPSTIVTALALLAVGVLITRSFQRWLSAKFLPTTTLDLGLRNSITTGMGYVGFILAAVIAFSQAGLDLSSLAIVAGALSVGIGFGLQSIVSNFVSGIILLAERPIKAGDWIAVGGEEGTVRKISVRSTEIETFDRATVIVPNADFISGAVKNMTYGNRIGRIIVPVGVGYDSDPARVRDLLLEIANDHPLILAYPQPHIIFSDFGASTLDFELRGFIADCTNGLQVRSDLRFEIFRRMKEEGIEIPFPQSDLNIKGLEDLAAQMQKVNLGPNESARSSPDKSIPKRPDAGDDAS